MMARKTVSSKRRFQFSLRTLLLLMIPASIVFGYIGWRLERTRRYETILAKLSRYNRQVTWEYGKPIKLSFFSPVRNFDLHDEELALVAQLDTLRELRFEYAPNITDDGLEHLNGLKGLEVLGLADTVSPMRGLRA